MKAELESLQVLTKGVVIESETDEERKLLDKIWKTAGGVVCMYRKPDGHIQIVVAPTVEKGNSQQDLESCSQFDTRITRPRGEPSNQRFIKPLPVLRTVGNI